MDWTDLSDDQISEFLQVNGLGAVENPRQVANQLIGQPNVIVTKPVYDLYMASLLPQDSPIYNIADIRNMTTRKKKQFATSFKLNPKDPHLLDRIIRILQFGKKLSAPSTDFSSLPNDIYYHIGLNLNYDTIIRLCATSKRFENLCTNPLFWKLKSLKDFAITSDEFDKANREIFTNAKINLSERETYISFAGDRNIAISGAERYGDISELTEAAAIKLVTEANDEYEKIKNLSLVIKYFNISNNYAIFKIFGQYQRSDLIKKFIRLAGNLSDLDDDYDSEDDDDMQSRDKQNDQTSAVVSLAIQGAAQRGNNEFILLMIKLIEILNFLNVTNYFPKYWESAKIAITNNHLSTVKLLAAKSQSYGDILIKEAARLGYTEIIDFLLTDRNDLYGRVLEGAALGGHWNIVLQMINKGATNFNKGLKMAAKGGHKNIMIEMINRGATDFAGALTGAAGEGHLDIVLDLINRGANNLNDGLTAASGKGHLNIVLQLIERGADAFLPALIDAAENGHVDIVKYLIDRVPTGVVPALKIAGAFGHLKVVKFLYDYSYIQGKKISGETSPLLTAATNGHLKVVKFILENDQYPISEANIIKLLRTHYFTKPNIVYYLSKKYNITLRAPPNVKAAALL